MSEAALDTPTPAASKERACDTELPLPVPGGCLFRVFGGPEPVTRPELAHRKGKEGGGDGGGGRGRTN